MHVIGAAQIVGVEMFGKFGQGSLTQISCIDGSDGTGEPASGELPSGEFNTSSCSTELPSALTVDLQLDGLMMTFGANYFGDFARSLFTLFQILTGDNSGNLARTLFFTYNSDESFNGAFVAFVAFYFVSYVVLSSWVLINVVVAVLLDKFIETDAEEQLLQQAQEAATAKAEAGAQDGGAPLPDGIELTTTPAAPPLTSAEAMEARLARLEEQQLRILSLLEAKLK